MDHLFDEQQTVSQDSLKTLSKFCMDYKNLEQDIERLEENLKAKKQTLEDISRVQIPSILNQVGLSELRLSSGEKLIVKDKLKASIPDKNYIMAYRSMIKEEGGDEQAEQKVDSLFKSKVILENPSDDVLSLLIEKEIAYEMKREIHYQTLNKYCREKLEQGKTIPEGISAFQYQETEIK
jgi:hypothetical protein